MKDYKIFIFLKKASLFVTKIFLVASSIFLLFGLFFFYNNRLFLWEASLIWPQENFSYSKFKTGSPSERSSMIVDLIRNRQLIGLPIEKIPDLLGEETGDYYHSDSNFTYKLTDEENANWILTLITKNGKIDKVFIRKSCCSISKKILAWGMDISRPLVKQLIE